MLDPEKVKTPGTDEWWVVRLAGMLGKDYPRLNLLEQWSTGKPPIDTVNRNDKFYAAKVAAREQARVHLARKIVENKLNRLRCETVRTAASDDDNGDVEANVIMKRNRMQKKMHTVMDWMLTYGRSYMLVEPEVDADGDLALIHEASPWQVMTVQDRKNSEQTRAGIYIYRDEFDIKDVIVLFNYDEAGKPYQRQLTLEGTTRLPAKNATDFRVSGDWQWGEKEPLETTAIPLVAFFTLSGDGVFAEHLGALARINEGVYKREFISASQAWRQRWIVKPDVKEEADTNGTFFDAQNGDGEADAESIESFELTEEEENALFASVVDSNPGTVSIFPAGTDLKESGIVDFRQLLEATKEDIKYVGEASNTLLSFAITDAGNSTSTGTDGILQRADDEALAQIEYVKGAVHMVYGFAFEIEGDEDRADVAQIESVWRPVRAISLEEKAAAFKNIRDAGMSLRTAYRVAMQMTPTEIIEEEQNLANQQFLAGLTDTTTEETTDAVETDQSTGGSSGEAA